MIKVLSIDIDMPKYRLFHTDKHKAPCRAAGIVYIWLLLSKMDYIRQ